MQCSIEGCEKRARAKGWCGMHYERWRAHGDPLVTLTPHRGQDPLQRYEDLVDRTSTPDGCHPWIGPLTKRWAEHVLGYGRIQVNGKNEYAHRWGYEQYVGPIPDGMSVRHTCDNPPCQNPDHWLLGTTKDNLGDRDDRERQARGERHGSSRLTEAQVREIREVYSGGGVSQESIAARYGVSQFHISTIVRRKSWKHIE